MAKCPKCHTEFEEEKQRKIIPIFRIAFRVHVPKKWLRDEVEAGRIPAIQIGRTWFSTVEKVEQAIESQMIRRA